MSDRFTMGLLLFGSFVRIAMGAAFIAAVPWEVTKFQCMCDAGAGGLMLSIGVTAFVAAIS